MGYIVDGKYYKGIPPVGKLSFKQQSTYKDHDHNRQRKDHARELVQPYDRNGKPNDKFIEAWPSESKEYGFTPSDDELKKL